MHTFIQELFWAEKAFVLTDDWKRRKDTYNRKIIIIFEGEFVNIYSSI